MTRWVTMFAKEMCEGKKDNFPDQFVFPQPLSAALLGLHPLSSGVGSCWGCDCELSFCTNLGRDMAQHTPVLQGGQFSALHLELTAPLQLVFQCSGDRDTHQHA